MTDQTKGVMKKESSVSFGPAEITIAAISVVGLYVVSRYSYLAFHTLTELFSIVIGFGLFMLTWNLRRIIDNNYLLFIGIAYLFVSGIDLAHTLSYKGIDVFAGRYGVGLNTQFWIAARYLESLALFASPFFIHRRLRMNLTLIVFTLLTALIFASIFARVFPVCYVEGIGLTRFKVVSEYVISAILLCSLMLLLGKRQEFDRGVLTLVALSIAATIGAELAFTFYVGFGDFSNLVGHFLKVFSFYLIYKAVIEIGLTKPYDLLFRNLKLREKDLDGQREWLRVTLTSIADAVIATDTAGRVTFVNPVAEALTGWQRDEAVGRPVTDVFPIIDENTKEPGENIVERVLREGSAVALANSTALVGRGGSTIPIEDSAAPIKDGAGRVTGVVLVFRDVTEKRKALRALRESEERFRLALCNAPVSVAAQDRDLRYVWAYNQGTARPGEIIGKRDIEIFTPEEAERVTALKRRVLDEDIELREQMWFERPGGPIFLDVCWEPIHDEIGRVAGVASAAVDLTPIKLAEEALAESEAKYRNLFANMTEEVHFWKLVRDGEGRIKTWKLVDANPPTLKTWGRTLGEIKDRTADEIFGPGATDHYLPVVEKIMGEGVPYSFEDYFPNLDKHFRFTSVPLGDYFITTGADITGIKKAQMVMEQQNAELEKRVAERTADVEKERRRLYDVLETLPAMICLLTPDHHVTFANKSFREKFGQADGRPCYDYCFGYAQPCDFCESYRVLETGQPHHWEVKAPDSSAVIDAYDFPFTDADGSPLILEMDIDITDQRRAEEALRRAGAYNRNLIEASLDPLVTIDPEGRISDVNGATEEATGYSRNELIGTDFSDYFTDPGKAKAGYRRVFAEGSVRDYPLELRHRDGRTANVLYNASVYRDESGVVAGVFAAARDVSEQQRLEAQLRQAQKMEALGTLTGGIAHDFNNILAAVIGFAEIAKDKIPEESNAQRQLARVLQAGIRGRELVRHMLTFSRETEQEKNPLPLSSIVKETTKLLRPSIPTTISIRTDVVSESGYVLADPIQMQQVVMNLCTNAAYAMREKGGALHVTLSDFSVSPTKGDPNGIRPGSYMRLTVTDTGTGIPPEVIDRIFDPFFTTKKNGEGTGLGLSVVHGIVRHHGGYITVESAPGRGSTFNVYLPKVAERKQIETPVEEPVPTGHERVLFVDDEEALVEMGRDLLEELGYAVTSKESSIDALLAVKEDPSAFDLIITDQTMPEMTGVELAKEILEFRPGMPVILCTGFSHLVNADQARAAGIKAFAMKPLTKAEIGKLIRQVLDG